ncbi:SCO family protein [Nocardioides dongkuii]|uniref:SCO family protein n=1 Tax=Nocardioides dongkuii TaxID=2760089 RepID=UPI0015FD9FDF|nr:SCO family protein [Nocardioides dongkuii]
MARRVLVPLLLLLLVLTGCSGDDAPEGTLNGTPVDPPFAVGDTELVDTDGEPMALTDVDARLTLVFFGYTKCPDVCPLVLQNIASALTRLTDEQREQVQVAFVSTDPAHDTPEVVRRYLDRFDPSYVGLTGELEDVVEVADTVGVFVLEGEPGKADPEYDPGAHGTQVLGMDADGEAPVLWGQDTSSAQYAADIELLLRDV